MRAAPISACPPTSKSAGRSSFSSSYPSAEKVRFHSSGTEATMMAIRMARAYTRKSRVIKFEDHFHGWSDALSAGSAGIGGIPRETLNTMIVLPPNDMAALEWAMLGNNDIAAIILEPTGAHMGLEPISAAFLADLRALTERHGVVLIFDEVVTGFRVSKGGAQELYGVTPDMTTMAKILGGGLPGGAVAGKADIINMIQNGPDPEYNHNRRIAHNGTFNANPLSAVAGIKALELLSTTSVNETADAMGQRLKDGINNLLAKIEVDGCATGISSLIFLRLGVDPAAADPDRNPSAARDMRASDNLRTPSAAQPRYAQPRRPRRQRPRRRALHPQRRPHRAGHRRRRRSRRQRTQRRPRAGIDLAAHKAPACLAIAL